MDIGSFVLDADGVRWAVDLGAEGYHGIESRGMNLWSMAQDSDRWKIFRQQNLGHNTLVIDGQLQVAAGYGKIIRFSSIPSFPHSIVDMSEVYAGQAESVRRGFALLPSREVLIQDQLTGLQPGSVVRWGMITPGRPSESGNSAMELTQGGQKLVLTILAPRESRWIVINTEDPPNEWDSPNPGTCMVAFTSSASESGELHLAVLITPESVSESVLGATKLRPLDQWGQ